MAIRVSLDPSTEIVLADASASIALPTSATDGVSIGVTRQAGGAGAWKENNQAHADAAIFVETSQATTLSAALGLFGYRADTSYWYLLGALNGGSAITTPNAAVGISTIVEFAGVYDRLAVGPFTGSTAVTPGAGTITVRATMIRQVSGN